MAAYRLCVMVAFSVVVSRPSTATRTGAPESGWWRSRESATLIAKARRQIAAGDYGAAEQAFSEGFARATAHNYKIAAARYLSGVAGARRARSDYQGALRAYQECKRTFEASGDWLDLGATDLNMSALYEEVWDLDSAFQAAQEGLAAARRAAGAYYEPELLLQTARLSTERGNARLAGNVDPVVLFLRAIESARANRDPSSGVEARGWSLLGDPLLSRGDLSGAEKAFLNAFSQRRLFANHDLGFSYFDLGALRLAAGRKRRANTRGSIKPAARSPVERSRVLHRARRSGR